jgi:pimeloyl-ACP methyl ester carboxylesterase
MRQLFWQIGATLAAIQIMMLSMGPVAALERAPRFLSGYAPVNGLKMYYEIRGTADGKNPPLVLIHGGGSTIETSFGRILPSVAKTRQVIAFEQQGHGHTADIDRPFTFEQSAEDTAALLRYLKIERADLFGYSNGGNIALQVAIRHPELVRKLIVASAMFKRDGLYPEFWESMKHATLQNMPAELREAYLKVAPKPENLRTFHDKCVKRMLEFKDWRPEDIQSIEAPTLVMIGDADVVRPEHAVEMFRLLPHAHLAVLPGTDHMTLVERADWQVSMVQAFLDAPMTGGSNVKITNEGKNYDQKKN